MPPVFNARFAASFLAVCAACFVQGASAQLKLPNTATPAANTGTARSSMALPQVAAQPSAPSDASAQEATGKLAAAGWLTLLDRRDWGTAWETSAVMFRTSVPLAAWMDGIPKVREPLGPLQDRSAGEAQFKTALEGRPTGEYVTAIFLTRFKDREVQEVVTTVREPDGKWRVTGYSTR